MSFPPSGIITDAMMAEWGMANDGPESFGAANISPMTYSNTTTNNSSHSNSPAPQQNTNQQQITSTNSLSIPPENVLIPYQSDVQQDAMPVYEQKGTVILGPGSHKEAILLGLGLPKLSHRQHDDLAKAKKYAMEHSIKHVLMKQTVAHQQQQQKMAMYAQALSLMARVYVGSISFELREDTIKNAFSAFGPIKSVNMSWDPVTGHHKGFAFLEYEVPEAAMLAQDQMNGVLMGGRNIKAQPIIDMINDDSKRHNRIYVASIHPDLSENDIKSVFEAFGPIRSIELAKGPVPGKHKGYAFIEYENDKAATDAVASMNLFDLGGQHLRVGRAITPPQAKEYTAPAANSTLPTAAAIAAAAVTAKIQAMDSVTSPMVVSPTVVVGTTPPPTMIGQTPVFTVPPPGIAIPQIPSQQTTPSVVMPQLYSIPKTSSASSISSSPSTVHGGASPAPFLTSQPVLTSQRPVVVTPSFAQPPASAPARAPPLQPVTASQTVSIPQQQQQPQQPQANAAQAAAQAAQKLLAPGSGSAPGQPNAAQQTLLDSETAQTLASQEDLKIKGNEARNILMHKLMRRTESAVLVLRNMVGPEDVDDNLQDEVADECSKYGQVEQVVIYQEKSGDSEYSPVIVKIFVKYLTAQEADTARNALDGRFFNGRKVKAQIYDQNLFDHQDLSG